MPTDVSAVNPESPDPGQVLPLVAHVGITDAAPRKNAAEPRFGVFSTSGLISPTLKHRAGGTAEWNLTGPRPPLR